jgi:hypothetical protein
MVHMSIRFQKASGKNRSPSSKHPRPDEKVEKLKNVAEKPIPIPYLSPVFRPLKTVVVPFIIHPSNTPTSPTSLVSICQPRFCRTKKIDFPYSIGCIVTTRKKTPAFSKSSAKTIFEYPIFFEKTRFLRDPYQWTPHISRNLIWKKLGAQKKPADTIRGDPSRVLQRYPRD